MAGIENFPAFLMAGILLNLTPGSDTLYILGRSIAQGKRAGIYSALGISAGCFVHLFFAAFGLSMLIAQSPVAFAVVKYAGAAYLVYLGVRMIASTSVTNWQQAENQAVVSYRKLFWSGVITNVLNPKVALFFIAFLPQFVQKEYSQSPMPFLLLGLTFNLTGTIWCLILALSAGTLGKQFRARPGIKKWLDRLAGAVFVGLGIKLAIERI